MLVLCTTGHPLGKESRRKYPFFWALPPSKQFKHISTLYIFYMWCRIGCFSSQSESHTAMVKKLQLQLCCWMKLSLLLKLNQTKGLSVSSTKPNPSKFVWSGNTREFRRESTNGKMVVTQGGSKGLFLPLLPQSADNYRFWQFFEWLLGQLRNFSSSPGARPPMQWNATTELELCARFLKRSALFAVQAGLTLSHMSDRDTHF